MKATLATSILLLAGCTTSAPFAAAPAGPPSPESYGARGDGRADDLDALKACLDAHGKCQLGPRTYVVRSSLQLKSGDLLVGSGTNSVLRLADHCVPAAGVDTYAVVWSPPWSPANNVVVSNLTVDCNFASQNGRASLSAVALYGTNNLLERVKAVGFQAGSSGAECFALFCCLGDRQSNAPSSTVRRCEVTGIADNPTSKAIVTAVAAGGGPHRAFGTLIEGCYVHDMTTSPRQQSSLHGLTTGGDVGARIVNNVVSNVYGEAIYQDTWHTQNALIASNRIFHVRYGICLMAPGGPTGATYDNVRIVDNEITLAGSKLAYDPKRPFANLQRGVRFWHLPSAYTNIVVSGNRINGDPWTAGGAQHRPEAISIAVDNPRAFTVTNNAAFR